MFKIVVYAGKSVLFNSIGAVDVLVDDFPTVPTIDFTEGLNFIHNETVYLNTVLFDNYRIQEVQTEITPHYIGYRYVVTIGGYSFQVHEGARYVATKTWLTVSNMIHAIGLTEYTKHHASIEVANCILDNAILIRDGLNELITSGELEEYLKATSDRKVK